MAFIINPSNKTQKIYNNGEVTDAAVCSIFIESQSDLADIPDTVSPGSLAYTPGLENVYQKDFDGNWVEVVLE